MRLVWKGKYTSESDLLRGALPPDAKQFKEPDTPAQLGLAALPFLVPPLLLFLLAIAGKALLWGQFPTVFHFAGFLLALACIIPHELLHAIAFPKNAEVEIWHALRDGIAFVYSNAPITKRRFIFLSLLPNLVFGLLPLGIWIFLPPDPSWTGVFSTLAITSLTMGAGDYLNVSNAARQVPKGAITQLSGFHSYWYMPQ